MKFFQSSRPGNGGILGLGLGLVLVTAATASASSVYVANNGVDSVSCGTKTDPCRSITKGIANALPGDTVVVGPGSYGDLDGDGTLGETGEEVVGTANFFWDCALLVDKLEVSVVSSAGAWSTFIRLGDSVAVDATVCLDAAGTAFGAYGKGFTVEPPHTGSALASIYATAVASSAVVTGNVTSCGDSNARGITAAGDGVQLLQNRVPDGGCAYGIGASGSASVIRGNTASGNFYGFQISSGTGMVFDGNVAVGNGWAGLRWETEATITRSSFSGNMSGGIVATVTASGSVSESNFVGNGVYPGYIDCGVINQGSTGTWEGNWWGAASGPGSAPANTACFGTLPASFADKAISVKPKGTR